MKSRPILFSSPMVRALLNGGKTQTRRIVKPQPDSTHDYCRVVQVGPRFHIEADQPQKVMHTVTCPYGQPGDQLWVKETFSAIAHAIDDMTIRYAASEKAYRMLGAASGDVPDDALALYYRMLDKSEKKKGAVNFPSIFMPKWASRITLEIVSVRVERLNDISAADAIAEGIESSAEWGFKFYGEMEKLNQWTRNPVWSYESLWESINGPGSWAANPWVWRIAFRKVAP